MAKRKMYPAIPKNPPCVWCVSHSTLEDEFKRDVHDRASRVDPENEMHWGHLTVGYALGKGLNPETANGVRALIGRRIAMEHDPEIRDVIHYLRTKYPHGGMVDATWFLRQVIGYSTLKERLLLLYKIEKGKENDYGKEQM